MAVICPQCGFTNLPLDRICVRCRYALAPAPAAGAEDVVPVAPAYVSAGFARRAGARVIDDFGVVLVAGILGVVPMVILGAVDPERLEAIDRFPISWMVGIAAVFVYHGVAEGLGATTVGKLLLDLRVVAEGGGPIDLRRGFVRSLWYNVDALVFGAVGYERMRRSPMRQRIGDQRAATLVVGRRDLPRELRPRLVRSAAGVVAGLAAAALVQGAAAVLVAPAPSGIGGPDPVAARSQAPSTARKAERRRGTPRRGDAAEGLGSRVRQRGLGCA